MTQPINLMQLAIEQLADEGDELAQQVLDTPTTPESVLLAHAMLMDIAVSKASPHELWPFQEDYFFDLGEQ